MSAGGNVLNAGVIPTPAVAVLVKEFNADSGIVISHHIILMNITA